MSVAKSKGFTGFHMWMLALGFFGVIIAVNVTMATFAKPSRIWPSRGRRPLRPMSSARLTAVSMKQSPTP